MFINQQDRYLQWVTACWPDTTTLSFSPSLSFSLPLSLTLIQYLSLPLSLAVRQYKSRHVLAGHQKQAGCWILFLQHRGGGRSKADRGKPRERVLSMTQPFMRSYITLAHTRHAHKVRL